ncbi:hypothetical protein NKH77_46945 [Streptomyces sp. M19]
MFSELFATSTRYTGLAVASQIPSVVVGAWPYAATALLIWTDGNPWPIVAITVFVLLLGIVAALVAPETNRRDIVADTGTAPSGTRSHAAVSPSDPTRRSQLRTAGRPRRPHRPCRRAHGPGRPTTRKA